jgi:hypothetical protein
MEKVSPVELGRVFIAVVVIQDVLLFLTLLVVLGVVHVQLLFFLDAPRTFLSFYLI